MRPGFYGWYFLPLLLAGCDDGGDGKGEVAPAQVSGSSYYVDAVDGNDGFAGSESQPFKTIGKGIGRLAPGGTLYICGGDYRNEGKLAISAVASAKNPIVLRGHAGGAVVVESVEIVKSAWIEVRGLKVKSGKTLPSGWVDMPSVMANEACGPIDPSENWTTRKTKVDAKYPGYSVFVDPLKRGSSWEYALYSDGINVVSSSHITIVGNDISMHTVGVNLRDGSSSIVVDDNAISYCLDAVRGDKRRADRFSFKDSRIRNNRITQTFREGIRLTFGAHGNIVEGNRVERSGHNHIATYHAGGNNRIVGNMVREGGYYAETMQYPGPSAISVHTAGPDTLVDGNVIALHVDKTLRDGNGIIVDYNSPHAAVISNNVIYRVMGSGISLFESGNVTIVHNTIVEAGFNTPSRKNGVGIRLASAADTGNIIANNIISAPGIGGILFETALLGRQAFLDHNLFHAPGVPLVRDGKVQYDTLAAFQKSGFSPNSVSGAPLFTDLSAGLFTVQTGSPALGKGTSGHSTLYDRAGVRRDTARPTIGAHERQSD